MKQKLTKSADEKKKKEIKMINTGFTLFCIIGFSMGIGSLTSTAVGATTFFGIMLGVIIIETVVKEFKK